MVGRNEMRPRQVRHLTAKAALSAAAAVFFAASCSSVVTPTPLAFDSPQLPTQSAAAPSTSPSAPPALNPTSSTTASPSMAPTPMPSLRGQYVGVLGWFSGCITLDTTSSLYEIYLSSDYRLSRPDGVSFVIVDANGNTVAKEGDSVGIDAEPLIGGGSSCQLGHKLTVNQVVDDHPGTPAAMIEDWSVSCGATSQLDCKAVTEAFINSFAGWGAQTVIDGTGRQLAVETESSCGLDLPAWATSRSCWQANAPWPASQSWQPILQGRICEVIAGGISGFRQFAGDYLGGAAIGPRWPPCTS